MGGADRTRRASPTAGAADSTRGWTASHLCDIDDMHDPQSPSGGRIVEASGRMTCRAPIARAIRISPGGRCSCPAAARASARRSSRAFAAQGCRVAFVDIADAPSQALAAELGADARATARCDVRDVAALRAAIAEAAEAFGPDPRARQQRRARRPARVRRRDARVLGREPRGQPAPSLLRRAGGRAAAWPPPAAARSSTSARSRGCADGPRLAGYTTAKAAISGLTRVLARELGDAQHPRQRDRARRDRDRAPARAVGYARGRAASSSTSSASSSGCRRTTSRAPRCSSPRTRRARITGQNLIVDAGLAQTSVVP